MLLFFMIVYYSNACGEKLGFSGNQGTSQNFLYRN
jgi:hypothetical protein